MEFRFGDDAATSAVNMSFMVFAALLAAAVTRVVYLLFFHPLSGFNGEWYAAISSLPMGLISLSRREPDYLMYLIRKYGGENPIRIAPYLLLFPSPSALRDIYWDSKCNTKGGLYGSGILGKPNLVTVIDSEEHRALRKALSNGSWGIGQLKRIWEPRFDDQINLFVKRMNEHALAERTVCISDKVGEFALDIMGMVSFSEPFGCVDQQNDVRGILKNWRSALDAVGFIQRSRFIRERLITLPGIKLLFQPRPSESGLGWLLSESNRQVSIRMKQNEEKPFEGPPDFLQHALDARLSDGSPLTLDQKRAQAFLLQVAGADTTSTAIGAVLRMLFTHPVVLARARSEIEAADEAGKLSSPIQYEETLQHLPFFIACIKEGLRLYPSAPNLLSRVVPPEGRTIDGIFVPGGMEVTSQAYCVQRSTTLYGPDAEDFNPERWMQGEKRNFELEAAQFTFGLGIRGCLGKNIALMEMYKFLPEIIRRFDVELSNPGRYVVSGGVAFHKDICGKFIAKQPS